MKNRNKKGFTIIELVIVIAVIGILTAVLVPVFINLTAKANEAADDSLVKNLNTALKMEEALLDNPKNETLQDAIDDLEAEGYILENLVSKSGKDLLWSQSENQFYLNKEDKYSGKDYWQIVNEVPAYDNQKYSYYAGKNFKTDVPNLKYGFDSGKVENITSLKYVGNGAPGQIVNIRTNSASTTLTIDDASTGTIYHYGAAGALNIIQCHTASYHEKGNVAFAEIAKGRIVLENGSEIKHIHVNANENADGFEEVIIADNGAKALPKAITRDQVDVSEAKPVVTVELGSTSETVYVYPYTDSQETKTGTTEKTDTQNTSIVSALGQLVLDNGDDAGEKAMSNNEKTSAKQEVVEVAQNEEEIEKAENAGYEVTHYDEVTATCTEDGHSAYDSYYVNNEEHKVGYKVYPATGHNLTYTCYTAPGNLYGHQSTCTNCGEQSVIVYCTDDDHDIYCDYCNQAVGEWIEVTSTADLKCDPNDTLNRKIPNGYYKLLNDIDLGGSNGYTTLIGNVVIDLNGHVIRSFPGNATSDPQFKAYTNENTTFTLTLKDTSASKTGKFVGAWGGSFVTGSGGPSTNRFVINCEDGVKIDMVNNWQYQPITPQQLANMATSFALNVANIIEINNADINCGKIATMTGGTVTFNNCTIKTNDKDDFNLISGNGNVTFSACNITTEKYKTNGNILDSSSSNVTYTNGTTVNGVTK